MGSVTAEQRPISGEALAVAFTAQARTPLGFSSLLDVALRGALGVVCVRELDSCLSSFTCLVLAACGANPNNPVASSSMVWIGD